MKGVESYRMHGRSGLKKMRRGLNAGASRSRMQKPYEDFSGFP